MHRDASPTRLLRSPAAAMMLAAIAVLATATSAPAERPLLADELPAELEGVGIVERLDEEVPLDLEFADEQGATIRLGDFFHPGRPVILTLNYYRCPMLCNLTLNGLVDGLRGVDWSAGREFDIITVSIDPDEGPELADVKKRAYLLQYDRETAVGGWHFLTGKQENIEALAKAVGFGYRKVKADDQFAHTSSIMFVTPDGRLSRYMNDVYFEPKDLRLAIVEASEGTIGSPMERFLLFFCYQYDPEAGSYAMSALKLVRLTGVLTMVSIVIGLFYLRRRGSEPDGREPNTPEPAGLGGLQS